MDTKVRERVLPGYLKRFGLDGGEVKSRTTQIVLAAVFTAGIFIARQITLPIFPPPLKGVEPSGIFYSSALLVLPYPYVWWFSTILTLTTVLALPAFPGWLVGFHIFYILGRLTGLKKARYLSFFASPINGLVMIVIFNFLGIMPLEMFFVPIMTKTFLQGLLALTSVPFIIKLLKKLGIVNYA